MWDGHSSWKDLSNALLTLGFLFAIPFAAAIAWGLIFGVK